ncbi:hypothetical protein P3519_22835, partial [Vibrio parahaemolyticus]|nr:hypothetical protein [Vibrio parahaemolyticus]
ECARAAHFITSDPFVVFLDYKGIALVILISRCEKTDLAGAVFRNTYWFDGLCKSFHDSPYHLSTSSIPALCLDSRCFGQSDAHQPPTKGSSIGGR